MEIHRRDPIVSIRLEMTPELAHLAPALEIVVGISALLERDDLGKLAEEQRKGSSGPHDANSHIMLVQHKDITAQSGLTFSSSHSLYHITYFASSISTMRSNTLGPFRPYIGHDQTSYHSDGRLARNRATRE